MRCNGISAVLGWSNMAEKTDLEKLNELMEQKTKILLDQNSVLKERLQELESSILGKDVPAEGESAGEIDQDPREPVFGKYSLIDCIGRGGMGEVWKARDGFGNIVAIKTLVTGEASTANQIKRLKREANAMASIPHRGICHIHEVGEANNLTDIRMDGTRPVALRFLTGRIGASNVALSKLGTSSFHLISVSQKSRLSQGTAIDGYGLRIWRLGNKTAKLLLHKNLDGLWMSAGSINGRDLFAVSHHRLNSIPDSQGDHFISVYSLEKDH
ncbi:hypothetical protein ACFL54_05580 [Planctomycetota bacterium]